MAALYGRLQGAAGPATRTGTDTITATVQTWEGALTLRLDRDGTATLELHAPKYGAPAGHGRVLWKGNVDTEGDSTMTAINLEYVRGLEATVRKLGHLLEGHEDAMRQARVR